LNGKVAEFLFNPSENKWYLVRLRSDKTRGNSLKSARIVLHNTLYNISFALLWEGLPSRYFEFRSHKQFLDMTKYINSVKRMAIQTAYHELT